MKKTTATLIVPMTTLTANMSAIEIRDNLQTYLGCTVSDVTIRMLSETNSIKISIAYEYAVDSRLHSSIYTLKLNTEQAQTVILTPWGIKEHYAA